MKNRGLILISIVSFAAFLMIAIKGILINFSYKCDSIVNLKISTIQTAGFIELSKIIGILFDTYTLVGISLLISVVLWIKNRKKDAIFFSVTMLISAIIIWISKELIQRARPLNILINETNSSFPSGHALIAIVFFGMISYLMLKRNISKIQKITTIVISLIIILIIGFSRIYLNAHWLSDILAGYFLGIFILALGILIYKKF